MKRKITEKNFFKITEKLSKKKWAVADELTALFEEMWADRQKSNLSHHIWGSLSLDLYLNQRVEEAIKVQQYAIEIAKKDWDTMDDKERQSIAVLYKHLAMYYENLAITYSEFDNYKKAVEAIEEAYKFRLHFFGKEDLFTRLDKESLRRLRQFSSFKANKKLKEELQIWVKKEKNTENK